MCFVYSRRLQLSVILIASLQRQPNRISRVDTDMLLLSLLPGQLGEAGTPCAQQQLDRNQIVHSASNSVDRLTPQLRNVGYHLSHCFYPQPFHLMNAVSHSFHRWTAEQLTLMGRNERRSWQTKRKALVETKRAMDAARAAMSSEAATVLDKAVQHAWHRFSYNGENSYRLFRCQLLGRWWRR